MSRHYAVAKLSLVNQAFQTDLCTDKRVGLKQRKELKLSVAAGADPLVTLVHGYDQPCYAYFCDLAPDCEAGIYYGHVGLTKPIGRWEYRDAMKLLGIQNAVEAVEWDNPY